MSWIPITFDKVYDIILESEKELSGEHLNFWELIKIYPEKWTEKTFGKKGKGFWVVGLISRNVIWYNDIEEGFNISS